MKGHDGDILAKRPMLGGALSRFKGSRRLVEVMEGNLQLLSVIIPYGLRAYRLLQGSFRGRASQIDAGQIDHLPGKSSHATCTSS